MDRTKRLGLLALAIVAAILLAAPAFANENRCVPIETEPTAPAQDCPTCPNGVCPVPAARTVQYSTAPAAYAPAPAASQADLVRIHNELHNGYANGPDWTWPGDLAEHLRTAHGVATSAPGVVYTSAPAACPNCPQQVAGAYQSQAVVYHGGGQTYARRPLLRAAGRVLARRPLLRAGGRVLLGTARVARRVAFGRRCRDC